MRQINALKPDRLHVCNTPEVDDATPVGGGKHGFPKYPDCDKGTEQLLWQDAFTGLRFLRESLFFGTRVTPKGIKWVHRQKKIVRIGIVAGIGTGAVFVTYKVVFFLNTVEPRASISWILSSTTGVFRRDHLQRWLVFPNTRTRYGVSLRKECLASILVLLLSSVLVFLFTELMQPHHRIAWAMCLIVAAAMEYCLLKFLFFREMDIGEASGNVFIGYNPHVGSVHCLAPAL